MRVNLGKVLQGLDGKELHVQEVKDGKVIDTDRKLTLRVVCTEALMLNNPQAMVTGEEKFKRYQLATKINLADDEVELKAEDIAKLKTLIGESYGTLVVGRAYDLLDPEKP